MNGFLYFIFDPRRLLYRKRFCSYLPVRECRKNQNGNCEVERMLHGNSPEISRHSTVVFENAPQNGAWPMNVAQRALWPALGAKKEYAAA